MAIDPNNPLDVLKDLLPASYKGVPFPIVSGDLDVSHSQARHSVFGKDTENVESTGLNSREYNYEIPFINGILAGPAEDALRGRVLFPDLYNAFMKAFMETTSGPLVDPIDGSVNVKPNRAKRALEAQVRGGVVVRAFFIESDDSADGDAPQIDFPSAMDGFVQSASFLDAQLGALTPPITKDDGTPFTSFSQFGALLRMPFDSLTLLSTRFGNLLKGISGELNALEWSINNLDDVNTWPIRDGIASLQNSVADLMQAGQREQTKLGRYLVPHDSTISAVLLLLKVDFDSLLLLNPTIADSPIVYANTPIIYKRTK